MVWIIRKDYLNALNDPLVKKILSRYVKVVKNELPSNFRILKKIEVELNEIEEKEAWKLHQEKMKEFRELKTKVGKGKVKLERMKTPKSSLLDLKIFIAEKILEKCELCEWKCGVNRKKGEMGFCRVGDKLLISSEFVHVGEESYFIPSHTIFFWSCNMQCIFCQNYTISYRLEEGIDVSPRVLAKIIEKRRKMGCRNVNFVGGEPTPYLPFILRILKFCEVNTPVLWNSNMYMSEKSMKLLEGVVDVYLTDFKFGPGKCSEELTRVKNYWNVVTRNHLIASEQAEMVIRHLVLPTHVECCSFPILEWVSKNIREKCLVNIMDQYTPYWKARENERINRRITFEEFQRVSKKAKELGIFVKE